MNKILIVQTAFLGDVILATPVVSELNRLFPDAKIDFLVKKGNESLLANNSKINSVITFDKSKGKWKSMIRLIKQFRAEKYDLVINLHRYASSGIISGLSKGKKIYGFKKNPMSFLYTQSFNHEIGDGTHEVSRNLALVRSFGAVKMIRPELYPSKEDFTHILHYQGKAYYCIAPASVWFTKQLPKEKWIDLINTLNKDATIYLLGGKDDFELCDSLRSSATSHKVENLCGKLSLLQSAALMKNAERCFVNDSGPLHLASSVNAPVTAYFCSTVPSFGFGPLSSDSMVKEVKGLDCRPCGLHGHKACPKGHFKCGKELIV